MKIAVIGRGGHSKVISDMILSNEGLDIVGYLDDKYEDVKRIEYTYYAPISSAKRLIEYFKDIMFVMAIGDNRLRQLIVRRLKLPEEYYIKLIHQSAVISPSATIGNGTVVMPNSVINADTKVGLHSIINTGSVIEHDCIIGDYSHVCPGVTLTGAVHLDEGAFIGAGATVIPNIKIGEWTIVGAGATVIHDISSHCTAVGTPAKSKKINQVRAREN
jgi:acetyltransferase EpsM